MDLKRIFHKLKLTFRRAFIKGSDRLASKKRRDCDTHKKDRPFFGLGRGAIGYLLLLAVAVVFSQALHSSISAVLLVFLMVWPLVNIIYLIIAFGAIDAYVEHDGMNAVKCQPTAFKIQIINHSHLPIMLAEAEFLLPEKNALKCSYRRVRIAIPPSSDHIVKKEISFAYRGTYEVGVGCVYVYDLFRIMRFRVRLHNYRSIYVMPRRFGMSATPDRASSDATTEVKRSLLGADRSEVSDIRLYEPGDPMKNVHWKLSSKSDELQVKQYDVSFGRSVYLFCDLALHFHPEENASYDEDINEFGTDGVVELALAIATKTVMEGNVCVPVWYDERGSGGAQMYPCSNSEELENVLYMLATAPVCSEDHGVGKLSSLVTETQSVTLIYVTDHLDGELLGDIVSAASLIGGSGTAVEVYFYDATSKINNEDVRQERRNYFNRCKRVLASHNVKVVETTAEKCSQESIA